MQHLVAVDGGFPSSEERLLELARLTGFSRYEAATRLRLLETRPGVIASFADAAVAEGLAENLRSSGFPAFAISGEHSEARVAVQTFEFEESALRVECGDGASLEVPTDDVRLILHGLRIEPHPRQAVAHLRSQRLGAFPYAQPRGWMGRESQFVHVYAPGLPAIVFVETELRFASNPGILEPTRAANFARVVEALRQHCKRATYDNRLITRGGQKSILGPTLRPEHHLDIAIALLTRMQRAATPYR